MRKTDTQEWALAPARNLRIGERVFHVDRHDIEMTVLTERHGSIGCGWIDEHGESMSGLFHMSKLVRVAHAGLRFNTTLSAAAPGFGLVSSN